MMTMRPSKCASLTPPWTMIYKIYGTSYTLLNKRLADGGEPDATILTYFHERQALYFTKEEYKALWGDEPNSGERFGVENSREERSINASKEQLEEALARNPAVGIQSML
ncbi:hypothetical protein LT330_002998 [Penicillium expansum]|uniref:Uncharacterized protein n=1 Tax=Penicillium expansum TaxID=27334 RepID=A0A0A2IPI8_PENEN|nr:hypothetical protein PEX2_066020 [Penicillium expansum]KAK4862865.1 hypothetical protein LT330_002998 [Penicillium expansum]KGO38785.1 hypothetical protein PEX1_106660 [Penicillium expansum]KGO44363.1 hypothetical protein PEXP_000540 [Penicillium expansum]KGO58618.1 hypothetical protein PEX2_066020 [Penicillium expansum]